MLSIAPVILSCAAFVHANHGTPYRCTLPVNSGWGREHTRCWFFDFMHMYCRMFIYYGSGGNENRFHSEKNCLTKCLPGRTPKTVCSKNPYAQRCAGRGPRWYFNSTRDTCQQLPHHYCATSANRFYKCVDCIERCSNVDSKYKCRDIIRGPLQGPGNPE